MDRPCAAEVRAHGEVAHGEPVVEMERLAEFSNRADEQSPGNCQGSAEAREVGPATPP
jgi:hypothetical protein